MTAKIYSFKDKDGKKPHHRPNDIQKIKKTESEIFKEVDDVVIASWIYNATNKTLNEYFISCLPDDIKTTEEYVGNLNRISDVERQLKMRVASYYPQTSPENSHGWMATFKHGKWVFGTPPDMSSEESARALNVLLFIAFSEAMKTNDER